MTAHLQHNLSKSLHNLIINYTISTTNTIIVPDVPCKHGQSSVGEALSNVFFMITKKPSMTTCFYGNFQKKYKSSPLFCKMFLYLLVFHYLFTMHYARSQQRMLISLIHNRSVLLDSIWFFAFVIEY